MKSFKYVEEYIEFLAGYEEIQPNSWLYNQLPVDSRPVQLSRRATSFIESLAETSLFNIALTDLQAAKACSIILEHKRQLSKVGIDVESVSKSPQYRIPLRHIKRTREINIVDNTIEIYFPYNKELVQEISSYGKNSPGHYEFNYDKKISEFSLNEFNIVWCYLWGNKNQFKIDERLTELYNLVDQCSNTDYNIKLIKCDTGYTVLNAEQSLLDYVTDNLGGWGIDNILTLIDYSGILRYDIDQTIIDDISQWKYLDFSLRQTRTLKPTQANLIRTLEYAVDTNRFPIYLYQTPTHSKSEIFDIIKLYFNEDEILINKNNRHTDDKCVKLIYVDNLHKNILDDNKIPLLISYTKMLHGSNKQRWINSAEKIVYLCENNGTEFTNQGSDGNSKNNYQGRS